MANILCGASFDDLKKKAGDFGVQLGDEFGDAPEINQRRKFYAILAQGGHNRTKSSFESNIEMELGKFGPSHMQTSIKVYMELSKFKGELEQYRDLVREKENGKSKPAEKPEDIKLK